jgi:hypothetical protein
MTTTEKFELRQTSVFETATTSSWLIVALGGFAFAVCWLRSFVFPNTAILFWGDAFGFATKGVRIIGGELPYRDFFEFVTPGTDLVYALLFHWLGVSLWLPNLLMCIMAAMATAWMTWCARRLVDGWFVLLPALLMTGFVLSGSLDATHHWFSTLSVMGAVAALFDGVSWRRTLAAGAMCGLAASFTQSKGAAVLVGLLIYLWWKLRRQRSGSALIATRCLQLCVAALVVFVAINGRFIVAAGLHQWLTDVIVFPLRYFGSVSVNNWRGTAIEFAERKSLFKWIFFPFMYLAVPLSYTCVFIEIWRRDDDRDEPWDQLLLLAIAGVAMLAMVAPALSIRRISCAAPPAMILLTWLLWRGGKPWFNVVRALGAMSVAVALAQIVAMHVHHEYILDLPAGRAVIPKQGNAEVYRWMAEHTHPGQWFFGLPPMTLPLGLRNPTPIESPAPGEYCRPEQIHAVIEGLERTRPPLLLLRPSMYVPHLLGYQADHLQPFQDYVFGHYRRTKIFATSDEVWERIGN